MDVRHIIIMNKHVFSDEQREDISLFLNNVRFWTYYNMGKDSPYFTSKQDQAIVNYVYDTVEEILRYISLYEDINVPIDERVTIYKD